MTDVTRTEFEELRMTVGRNTEHLAKLDGVVTAVVNAHLVFVSFAATGMIWGGSGLKRQNVGLAQGLGAMSSALNGGQRINQRIVIGCALLLITMGITALASGQVWVMVSFMIEAILVLVGGLIAKYQILWIMGAIALFVATMWFTRDMSFVWPVILGVGLIGAVIGIIIYNDRKNRKLK